MEYEKKKIPWFRISLGILGVILGVVLAELAHLEILTLKQELLALGVAVICFFLALLFAQLGHLILGLVSGYRFVSFRIGTLALCRVRDWDVEDDEDDEEEEESEEEESTQVEAPPPPNAESILAIAQMKAESAVPETPEVLAELINPPLIEDESDEEEDEELPAHFYIEKAEAGAGIDTEKYEHIKKVEEPEPEPEEEEEEEEEDDGWDWVTVHDYYRKFALRKEKKPLSWGECVMAPPSYKNPHYVPFKGYLWGGGIGNLVSIPFSGIFFLLLPSLWWVAVIFIVISLISAVISLLPVKLDGVPTDGYLSKLCGEDDLSHAAFVYQLRIKAALYDGVSVGDMPEEWFYAKFSLSERMTGNPLVSGLWKFTGDRFLIHGELFQAKVIYEALANNRDLCPPLQQEGMYAFLFTMISEGRVEQTRIYPIPKHIRKSAKKLEKYHPIYSAYGYAYGKLVRESGKRMKETTAIFEKVAKKHPYEGKISDFRVLMDRLDDVILMK